MNDSVIDTRRSVRKYLGRAVEPEKLQEILESVRYAPSACNSQPWHFVVIDDAQIKDRFCDRVFTGRHKFNMFAKEAPVLIVALADRQKFTAFLGGLLRNINFALMDVTIACEHIILKAHQLGLGTCWLGWFDEKAVKRELKIPASKKVVSIISIGYPADGAVKDKTMRLLEEKISFNQWR